MQEQPRITETKESRETIDELTPNIPATEKNRFENVNADVYNRTSIFNSNVFQLRPSNLTELRTTQLLSNVACFVINRIVRVNNPSIWFEETRGVPILKI